MMVSRGAFAILALAAMGARAESVSVAWEPVPDWRSIGKYEVHWGTSPGQYTEKKGVVRWYNSTAIDALEVGKTYYFAVRSCAPDLKSCSPFGAEFSVVVPPSSGFIPLVPMAQTGVEAAAQ